MEFLLVVFCIILVTVCSRRLVRALFLRGRFIRRVKRICAEKGYRIRRGRMGLASFFSIGSNPDLIISADREYCVRFITTIKRNRFYHFLDDMYAGSHTKMVLALPMAKGVNEFKCAARFHYLPKLQIPKRLQGRTDVEPILLFNPVPAQVLAIDKEGTRVNLVTNGSHIGQFTTYGGRAFCDLLEGRLSHGEQKETVGSKI